jgi:hypothetical protein
VRGPSPLADNWLPGATVFEPTDTSAGGASANKRDERGTSRRASGQMGSQREELALELKFLREKV